MIDTVSLVIKKVKKLHITRNAELHIDEFEYLRCFHEVWKIVFLYPPSRNLHDFGILLILIVVKIIE